MIVEQKKFRPVKFINLSISALGVFEKESSDFIQMLEYLNSDKARVKYIIRTRSYYRKESAASPTRDRRQHVQFAE
jgi:hypothetical protein